MMGIRTLTILSALVLTVSACGGDSKDEKAGGSIAKALAYESKERAAAEKASKEKADELAKKKAAEEAATKALSDAIAQVTVLPEKLPKNIKAACEDTTNAYEQFMRDNRDAGMVMEWFNNKGKNLGAQRQTCEQDTVEAAACLTHALNNRPDALLDRGEEGVTMLQVACADKFGKSK